MNRFTAAESITALAAVAGATGLCVVGLAAVAGSRAYVLHLGELSARELADLFVFMDPVRAARISAWLLLALPVGALAFGAPLPALVVALLLWLLAPRLLLWRLRARRQRQLLRQLPECIDALVSALRSGLGLGQAVQLVSAHQPRPLANELILLTRHTRVGLTFDGALEEFARRCREREFQLFVASLRLGRELGGGLGDALERVGRNLRRQLAMRDRIDALTSQGRLQGVIVSLLPLALVGALAMLEPETVLQLLKQPVGWAVIGATLLLQSLGWLWIRRIVRIDV